MFKMGMKHTIELKMPKLFKRKKNENGEEETEVTVTDSELKKAMSIAVPLVLGIGIGYAIGYKKGVLKDGSNVFIVK